MKALESFETMARPWGYRTVEDMRADRRTDLEFTRDEHLAAFLAAYPDAGRCTGDDSRCRCAWHRRPAKIDIASVGAILDDAAAAEAERARPAWLADLHAETQRVAALTPDLLPQWLELIAQETRA